MLAHKELSILAFDNLTVFNFKKRDQYSTFADMVGIDETYYFLVRHTAKTQNLNQSGEIFT